jgi:hypothetical protein
MLLGTTMVVTAVLPRLAAVEVALIPVGALAVFFGTNANAHMQVWSEPRLRGRVMAIYTLLTLGSTVIGGPFVGWVCQHWNPRVGIGLAGAATLAAAVVLSAPLTRRVRPYAPRLAPGPAAGD